MYANLRGELFRHSIQQNAVASKLGLHENTINNKLSVKSRFTIEEAFAIKQAFFPEENLSLNYLFASDDIDSNSSDRAG